MSKQIHIFATKKDITEGLKSIESVMQLKYVLCGIFETPTIPVYHSLFDYNDLSINKTGDHIAETFIVMDAKAKILTEEIIDEKGKKLYSVYPNKNSNSITFSPGGIFANKHLVCGHIGTTSKNPEVIVFLRKFTKFLTKGFSKIQSYYVGPEAEIMLNKGARLITISVNSPDIYDLKRLMPFS